MATVIDVTETWSEDAGWTHSGEPGSGRSTAKRKFVVTTTTDARPQDVLVDNRIPQVGAPHPWNTFFRCRATSAERTGPISFEVTSNYDVGEALDGDVPPDQQSPTNQPAVIRISTIKETIAVDEEVPETPGTAGELIANTNGEPFPNGVQKLQSDMAIQITKNLAAFDFNNIDNFVDTVNSAAFLGFPPGRLRIDSIEAESVDDGDFSYWRATVVIHSRRPVKTTDDKAWYARVRNEGYKEKILVQSGLTFVPKTVQAKDAYGDPVSQPVVLDSDGFQVTPDNGRTPHWLEFKLYQETDFNNLNLLPATP